MCPNQNKRGASLRDNERAPQPKSSLRIHAARITAMAKLANQATLLQTIGNYS
jgi:hypothetical protein